MGFCTRFLIGVGSIVLKALVCRARHRQWVLLLLEGLDGFGMTAA